MEVLWVNDFKYRILARDAERNAASGSSGEQGNSIDWKRLWQINPGIVAWLRIEMTDIDLPVAQPSKDQPRDWYLNHDAWGRLDELGCPYLDARNAVDNRHLLIFGHRVTGAKLMFSELADAHRQDTFNQLGRAELRTPGCTTSFTPLFALKTDESDADIQRFSFETVGAFRAWIRGLLARASATTAEANALSSQAERALTLVTCSDTMRGGRARTLVIFIAQPQRQPLH